MVNADRSNNCTEMGAFAVRKHEQNGSATPSLFSPPADVGTRVYKLLIHIEKIRPKPCPKSKKLALLTAARRQERIRAGVSPETVDRPSSSPKKTAICMICKDVFQSAQSLYLHKKKRHSYICNICHVECATQAGYESHEKTHSLVESESAKTTKPATRVSLRSDTSNRKPMVQSAKRNEDLEYNGKIAEKTKKVDGKLSGNYAGLKFTCRVCSEDFATVEAAEAHTQDHMEVVQEEHKCSICKKLFKSETTLNDHLAEHLSRALRCPVCPKAFINRATLRIHMKSHGQG